eukprot:3839312-Rhodomonas_salina.1
MLLRACYAMSGTDLRMLLRCLRAVDGSEGGRAAVYGRNAAVYGRNAAVYGATAAGYWRKAFIYGAKECCRCMADVGGEKPDSNRSREKRSNIEDSSLQPATAMLGHRQDVIGMASRQPHAAVSVRTPILS